MPHQRRDPDHIGWCERMFVEMILPLLSLALAIYFTRRLDR
jgi:hypothetical protein